MRALMRIMRAAEGGRQQALTTRDIAVAGDVVVEGADRRKQARHQKQTGNRRHRAADIAAGEIEEEGGRVRQRADRRQELLGSDAGNHQPGGEDEEQADHQDREIGRTRNGLFRIARLLGIDRRRLEADEGAEAEQDCGRQRAGEHGRRVEEIKRKGPCPALAQNGEIDQQHDEIFEQHKHDHHLGREIDLPVAEDADEGDGDQAPEIPGQFDAEAGEHACCHAAEQADQAELHGIVGDHRDDRHGTGHAPAEPARGIGIEGAGIGDVARHRYVAGREGQHDQRHQKEGCGNARAVAEQEGDRHRTGHAGERGRGRDDHEGHGDQPQRISAELVYPRRRNVSHWSLQFCSPCAGSPDRHAQPLFVFMCATAVEPPGDRPGGRRAERPDFPTSERS